MPRRLERPVSQVPWLRHLGRHVPVAVRGDDPEGAHQVRVAAGRVAVWLELGGHAVLRDDLRALRRSVAAVRDCDVLLLTRPPAAFADRLRERRERAREGMLAHLRGPHARALRSALSLLPPVPRRDAVRALPGFVARVERRIDRLTGARHPADEDFHRVRRAVRKLRYALEWLGEDASAVKDAQQVFGDLNDLAVEASLLAETGAAADLPDRARTLRVVLAAKRRGALRVAKELRANLPATEGAR